MTLQASFRPRFAALRPIDAARVLDVFLHDSLSNVWTMIACFGSGDREGLISAAASLRSSSLIVGADELANLCAAIEAGANSELLELHLLQAEAEAERIRGLLGRELRALHRALHSN